MSLEQNDLCCALKCWCPEQDSLRAGQPRSSCVFPCLASCSTVLPPGCPSTFPGRSLTLPCSLAETGLKTSCAGLQTGRETHCSPRSLQLTHTLAQRSGCADALAFRFPSLGTQSGIVKGPSQITSCVSLHEKYADSDVTIITPRQLSASVSP